MWEVGQLHSTDEAAEQNGLAMAEVVEGRELTKENTGETNTSRTQRRINDVPNGLDRVRKAALRSRNERFSALFHHITVERLWAVFFEIKKKASPGVDGVTWEQYEMGLKENLEDLHSRLHRGA